MKFTKREKFFLAVCGGLLPILYFIPMRVINDYELLWQLFIILPLGIMIATDPERISKGKVNDAAAKDK